MGIGPGRITKDFAVNIARPQREEIGETTAFIDLQRNVQRAIREGSRLVVPT